MGSSLIGRTRYKSVLKQEWSASILFAFGARSVGSSPAFSTIFLLGISSSGESPGLINPRPQQGIVWVRVPDSQPIQGVKVIVLYDTDDWWSAEIDDICLICKQRCKCGNYPYYAEGCPVYRRKRRHQKLWSFLVKIISFDFIKNK